MTIHDPDPVLPENSTLSEWYRRGDLEVLAVLAPRCWTTDDALAVAPRDARLIALACAMTGRVAEARRLLTALAAAEPGDFSHRMNLGVLELQTGHAARARSLLEACREQQPDGIDVLFNLGLACFVLGDFVAAAEALQPVVRAAPAHDVARLYLARSHCETGDVQAALRLAEGQRFANVEGIHEQYELSKLYSAIDQAELAEHVLRSLLAAEPGEATARINLAVLLERANRLDDAQSLLDQIRDPTVRESAGFHLTQAKLLAGRKSWLPALTAFDKALERTDQTFDGPEKMRVQSDIEFGRGHVLDKLGRYDEAHRTLVRANALIRDHFRHYHPARIDDGRRIAGLDDIQRLDAIVAAAARESPALSDIDTPIFLVGFPRSGTTLLDQILDAHPALQVLEEKPALDTVANLFDSHPDGYPAGIASLQASDVTALRNVYWKTVGRYLQRKAGTRLVDKYPLNLARIHLAMRLFPQAQWIFAIRHPCDVVLSCFMQNFRFTESTHGFWSIEQTASIYEQVMSLWLAQRARLQPDCFDLRYEDLVAEFEPNARRLIAFLKLPWHAGVLRYNEHAKTRRISTPSYNQVVEPIYKTAAGRWRNYEQHFGDALPMLQPFIEQLGYER